MQALELVLVEQLVELEELVLTVVLPRRDLQLLEVLIALTGLMEMHPVVVQQEVSKDIKILLHNVVQQAVAVAAHM